MRVVITHLTRMQSGYVCIAGIDPVSGEHVRPVVPGRRIRRDEIQIGGSEVVIGTELDLGHTTATPAPPEVEDHVFSPAAAKRVRVLPAQELADLLRKHAGPSLNDILGKELEPDGATASIAAGAGRASLGCLAPTMMPEIGIDSYQKVKVNLRDGGRRLLVTVADLRLYESDQKTPDRAEIDRLQSALRGHPEVLLSVGLSRAFARPGGSGELRHWLQINNIHVFGT